MLAQTVHPFVRAANLDAFTRRKSVTITEFQGGVEVFIRENHETCSDGALFEERPKTERGEGDREKNRERAARRAKTNVRRQCKMIVRVQVAAAGMREGVEPCPQ